MKKVSIYTDTGRKLLSCLLVIFCVCPTTFVLYSALTEFAASPIRFLFIALFAAFIVVLAIVFKKQVLCFFAKNTFSEKGIGCTLFGKDIKHIAWRNIQQIVSIEYRFISGDSVKYLFFSGHTMSDADKNLGFKNAAMPNDIFVIRCSDKAVEKICDVYSFDISDSGEHFLVK